MTRSFFKPSIPSFWLRFTLLLCLLIACFWLLDHRGGTTFQFEQGRRSLVARIEPAYPLFPGSPIQLQWESQYVQRLRINDVIETTSGTADYNADVCQT